MSVDGTRAIAYMRSLGTLARHGYCLYYVWKAYASAGARTNLSAGTALQAWHLSNGKHAGDWNPPAGVPVWFGSKPGSSAGDVVISLGNGRVIATDQPRYGVVGECTIAERQALIGRPYLGWTDHIFDAPITHPSPTGSKEDDMTPEESAMLKTIYDRVTKGLTGPRIAASVWGYKSTVNGIRFGDMLRVLFNALRYGVAGKWHHGTLTAAILSEIGAQKIYRAENGGKSDLDVAALAEELAPLLNEQEADALVTALLKAQGKAYTEAAG